ncbi:MAG: WbqC family protein [Proteobacteria bacterium]|nr:WbqC family protein [Pseudomonadota bacterium]
MIISINQPAYLPWCGYFNRIIKSDLHVVLDTVQFEKNSFINRNKIIVNGGPIWLTVPVLTKSLFGELAINALQVDNKTAWQKKHWLSIKQAYSKNPFFFDMQDFLENIYAKKCNTLMPILKEMLNFFLGYMSIQTPIIYASHYDFYERKGDLVLEICKKFGAKKYLSGSLGRDYLDVSAFSKHNISVIFDDYTHPIYEQKNNSNVFISHLSSLDMLMRFGAESRRIIEDV